MTYEEKNAQYAGRRDESYAQNIQARGRFSAKVAADILPDTKNNIAENYAEVLYANTPVAVSYGEGQKNLPQKQGLSNRTIIGICILAGLVILLFIISIVTRYSGKGKTEDTPSASETAYSFAQSSEQSEELEPEVSEAPPDDTVKNDEYLYKGSFYYNETEDFNLSLVLSSDLSEIYEISIEIASLNATIEEDDVVTTIEVMGITETYSGEYPVEVGTDGSQISIDKSKLRIISFSDNHATVELDYIYYSTDSRSGDITEIPLGVAVSELTTDTPPPYELTKAEEEISTNTVFEFDKVKNWKNEFAGDVKSFTPADPQPMYYIVCVDKVIDPKTWVESEGGYENNYTRHKPVSTDNVLWRSGRLNEGGLTLTDDPDLATYALIVSFAYDHNGTFQFSDGTSVTQYHGTTSAELYNMVSGDSIYTGELNTFATYANENVYTAMLDNAKGNQFYARSHEINASNFYNYWDFVKEPS